MASSDAFTQGEAVWVVCHGEFADEPFGLYPGTVLSVLGATVSVVCSSHDLMLEAKWNAFPSGQRVACEGAPGGKKAAALLARDAEFPSEVLAISMHSFDALFDDYIMTLPHQQTTDVRRRDTLI